MIRSVAALAALTALAGPALAQDAAPLSPGKPVRGTLPDQGRIWRSYRIEVPEGATALDLRVTANGDADLYARALSPMENRWSERADASSAGPDGTERIRLTPEDGLCACVYYVDVVHGDGAAGRTLKYTLKAAIERGDANGAPPPDGERFAASASDDAAATFSSDFSVDVDLTRGDDNYVTYRVDVGPDVSEVRLALTGARADLGLYAHYGAAMPNWFSAHHRARSSGLDKTLVLSRDGVPRLRTGVYYVDVGRGPDGGSTATLSGTFIRGFDGEEAPGRLPDASTEADVTGEIRTDSAFRVSLDEGPRYRTYLIHVPPQAQSLTVRETGANGDVDLYLRHGAPIAIEAVDACLGRVWEALQAAGGEMIVTADHGNAEKMRGDGTGQPHTAHTTNRVPLVYAGRPATLAPTGALCDVAPTLLHVMGLEPPPEMTGRSLLRFA